ncbi:MAG: hypothetical protein K0M70_06905, partial [Arenimonas sp.]|uniref:hypothetical protein n=1 Tax=Arenimonas sp. TaxID=1872635 RepID=UPI0025BFFBCD
MNGARFPDTIGAPEALESMLRDLRLKLIAAASVALLHVGVYQLLSHSGGAPRRPGPAAAGLGGGFNVGGRPPGVAPPPP